MATIGSAKATLVNKIDSLTSSATAKDTIFLAKALKENTSHHSFTFQGAWAASTAYALDDVVTTSGKTYICILAYTSGSSFAVGSNWSLMAEKGTDGTTVGVGTAGQVLKTKSDLSGTEWGSGGMILGVHYSEYSGRTTYSDTTSRTSMWNALTFTKQKANSKLHITLQMPLGGAGNSYPHFAEGFIRFSTSTWDANGTDIHGPILNTRATSNNMGAGYFADFVYDTTSTNISGAETVYIRIGFHSAAGNLHPASVWNPNASDESRSWQSVSYITVTEVDA